MLLRMNVWRSLRGLPRDLWVLSAATLINRLGMMAIPFLVLYLTRELEWSAPRAGLALIGPEEVIRRGHRNRAGLRSGSGSLSRHAARSAGPPDHPASG